MSKTCASDTFPGLNASRREIRLLEIHSGQRHEQIRGTLRVVCLDECPAYEALSYTWGSPKDSQSIILNDQRDTSITPNLFAALLNLRRRLRPRVLWVDAVCIDQTNDEEKSHQITLMGDIYRHAASTLVWLGEPGPSLTASTWSSWVRDWTLTLASHRKRLAAYAPALDSAIENSTPRWHDRAWVIQEFMLSRTAYLCFGPYEIKFIPGALVAYLLEPAEMDIASLLGALRLLHERTSDLYKLQVNMRHDLPKRSSITDVLAWTSASSATDLRDKVYSLLSLIDDDEARMIGTSYKRTAAEVFARATFAPIAVQKNLIALEHVTFGPARLDGLASWAIDFTSVEFPPDGVLNRNRIHFQPHEYPGSHRPAGSALASVQDDKRLILRVTTFDRVVGTLGLPYAFQLHGGYQLAEQVLTFANRHLLPAHSAGGTESPPPWMIVDRPVLDADRLRGVQEDSLCWRERCSAHSVVANLLSTWNHIMDIHPFARPTGPRTHEEHTGSLADQSDMLDFYAEYPRFATGQAVLFVTEGGFLGIASSAVEAGDDVVLARPDVSPLVLRPRGDHYVFRGLAYVHGISDGELIEFPGLEQCRREVTIL
ncbi:hypothetical protein LTR53_003569 [Teratosphaeriaceae sp. CCFEE 6253]|nr:hypothetical protein LTR53_003569 [Teratosphaeriaceae sp. CCFEE 6253]